MNKLLKNINEAIDASGLKSGMTISFHHHLRNGDYLMNMVLDAVAKKGIKNLTLHASSIFECHEPLIDHIKNGVVTQIYCNYMSKTVGTFIANGGMKKPVIFRTHGSRPGDIMNGKAPIDVAFIGAPTSDDAGNCTGKRGPARFGSMGYAMADAEKAKKVIVITDNLVEYPLPGASITEDHVDFVVKVDAIGDPEKIVSGTTTITRDPVRLRMAQMAVKCIEAAGLLEDGMSFQTGAGGATLAVAKYLKERMLEKGVVGSYITGGITSFSVDLQQSGCFRALLDVQSFDTGAAADLDENPNHIEVSGIQYASAEGKSTSMTKLDCAMLGATEIDVDFNVNVHTDSMGNIMGGSGGHTDIVEQCRMAVIIAPLFRNRLPIILDHVRTISSQGKYIDVLITEKGVAVNENVVKENRVKNLKAKFKKAGIPVVDIKDLKAMAEEICGVPKSAPKGTKVVAEVLGHSGEHVDYIYKIPTAAEAKAPAKKPAAKKAPAKKAPAKKPAAKKAPAKRK